MDEYLNVNMTFPVNGEKYNAQHVWTSMKVFINPVVAALPQHAHLFNEFGCFDTRTKGIRECGVDNSVDNNPGVERQASLETPLEKPYYPYTLTTEQDEAWYKIVKANIPPPKPTSPPTPKPDDIIRTED